MRSHYVRCPDLEELWRESRDRPGGERKITRKYAPFQVLVLDEQLLDRPDELLRGFLLELMEARYGAWLDRLLHPVPPEGLARPARRRHPRRRHHGPHSPRSRLDGHGRDEHAQEAGAGSE